MAAGSPAVFIPHGVVSHLNSYTSAQNVYMVSWSCTWVQHVGRTADCAAQGAVSANAIIQLGLRAKRDCELHLISVAWRATWLLCTLQRLRNNSISALDMAAAPIAVCKVDCGCCYDFWDFFLESYLFERSVFICCIGSVTHCAWAFSPELDWTINPF